jgi:hypothetical protein
VPLNDAEETSSQREREEGQGDSRHTRRSM